MTDELAGRELVSVVLGSLYEEMTDELAGRVLGSGASVVLG